MRWKSHPEVWALRDCACTPTPELYPCNGARARRLRPDDDTGAGDQGAAQLLRLLGAAGSLLLAACPTFPFSVDHLRRPASPRAARRDQLDLP